MPMVCVSNPLDAELIVDVTLKNSWDARQSWESKGLISDLVSD